MEKIIECIRDNPQIELPYPIRFETFAISYITGRIPIEDRVYEKSGIITLYGIPINVTVWCQNSISITPVRSGGHALSFSFTGCCMAKYVLGGKRYVAHIHCDRDGNFDCKRIFTDYMHRHRIINCMIFRPLGVDEVFHCFKGRDDILIWGLISKNDYCYSLCLAGEEGQTTFEVICIVQHIDAEKKDNGQKLFQYVSSGPAVPLTTSQYSELTMRWDAIFRYEKRRIEYIDPSYRKYLKFGYR